jgi:hypothetical protein
LTADNALPGRLEAAQPSLPTGMIVEESDV